MRLHLKALAVLLMLTPLHGVSVPAKAEHQKLDVLRHTVEQFLHIQAGGMPGKVSVEVGSIDSRLKLPACAQPQAFLPRGRRAWGKITVGVRCSVPSPWSIYVSAIVKVRGSYIITAAPLAQGQSIGPNDIAKVEGDLTMLPPGIVTDESQVIGRTLSISLPLGTPLRQDALRSEQAVQQGQIVRLVSGGPGFQVSGEARSLSNAADGQVAQARTSNGQVVSGIARLGGIVEVNY
jgi:flagella basal body P-ring formation protein FlgA